MTRMAELWSGTFLALYNPSLSLQYHQPAHLIRSQRGWRYDYLGLPHTPTIHATADPRPTKTASSIATLETYPCMMNDSMSFTCLRLFVFLLQLLSLVYCRVRYYRVSMSVIEFFS